MTILKLPNEGDTYTGHVTTCAVEAGKYGEQVKFGFANGDVLYIGKPTADRQLLRLKFDKGGDPPEVDYGKVPGNTLAFSRDHNKTVPDKPYWGISVASAADLRPQTPSKRLAGPSSVPGEAPAASDPKRAVAGLSGVTKTNAVVVRGHATKEDIVAAYEFALTNAKRVQEGFGTPETISQCATHLNICLKEHGLVAGFSLVKFEDVKAALDLEDGPPDDDDLPF